MTLTFRAFLFLVNSMIVPDIMKFPFYSVVYRKNNEEAGIFCRIIYEPNGTAWYEIKWPDGSKEECAAEELQLTRPIDMDFSDRHDE